MLGGLLENFKFQSFKFRVKGSKQFKTPNLESGTQNFELETWNLEPGTRNLKLN